MLLLKYWEFFVMVLNKKYYQNRGWKRQKVGWALATLLIKNRLNTL
jgi:hypothetical protein